MLKVHEVDFSKNDLKKNIFLPKSINADLAEEIGIHIGDGSMNIYNGRSLYSLRGHVIDDKMYFSDFIPKLYQKLYGISPKIRKWPDVVGFQIGSKAIVAFKHEIIGLPLGPKNNISIPLELLKSKKLLCSCLRGIFDTDGTLSFEKKSRDKPYYPRIIFSTTSEPLCQQLGEILKRSLNFNLSIWSTHYENKNWKTIFRICIRGEKNLNKWFKLIGSSNSKNILKYDRWKEYGYIK